MFRLKAIVALALTASLSPNAPWADAPEPEPSASITVYERLLANKASAASLADEVVGRSGEGAVLEADIPGASDVVRALAIGSGDPVIVFIALSNAEDTSPGSASPGSASPGSASPRSASRWSEAAWLSMLEALALTARRSDRSPGTVYLILVDDDARAAVPVPGDPLIRGTRLRYALADMGVDAAVLLDLTAAPGGLALRAASFKRLAPRRVVEAARAAAKASGLVLDELPIVDFYAAAGLSAGSVALAPWLDAGLPAIALESTGSPGTGKEGEALVAFAEALTATVSRDSLNAGAGAPSRGEDVNYLRYPAIPSVISLSDEAIVTGTLTIFAALAAAMALGALGGRRRRVVSAKAVARESLVAFGLSLAAIGGAEALGAAALALARLALGPVAAPSSSDRSWSVALALGLRVLGALSVYYAASGTLAKLGLHGDHGRLEAARAALALLCVDTLVAVAVYPPAAPFPLVAVVLVAIASGSAAAAALGLAAVAAVALPFFDPRVLAAIGDAHGGAGSVAQALLRPGLRGAVAMAAFAAPFGLWLGAASSPEARLRRGRRTAPFWLLGAIACAVAEALARIAGASP